MRDLRKYINQIPNNRLWNIYVRCVSLKENYCFFENMFYCDIFDANYGYTDRFQFDLAFMIEHNSHSLLDCLIDILNIESWDDYNEEYEQIIKWYKKQPRVSRYGQFNEEEYEKYQKSSIDEQKFMSEIW